MILFLLAVITVFAVNFYTLYTTKTKHNIDKPVLIFGITGMVMLILAFLGVESVEVAIAVMAYVAFFKYKLAQNCEGLTQN